MNINITYWSDFSCPYCYIGETRLKKAITNLGLNDTITLVPKAFRLDPNAPLKSIGTTQDRFAQKYRISNEQAGDKIKHISELGYKEGLEFNYSSTLFTNNMDAHRIIKMLQDRKSNLVDTLQEELLCAYFSKNKELADRQVLLEITDKYGINSNEVINMLDSDDYKEQVLQEEQEAYNLGVRAVPYFLIDDEITVTGAQTQEVFEQALKKIVAKNDDLTDSNDTGTCGPEGCSI